MTKELFILFVYDTQLCQREEDDPQEAVLYFYPGWVTEQQRLALCGQLMGATQFFLSAFSCPHILSLNSGKFAIKQYGRYIIAVGTDRNVPDWIIDHRAKTLHYLLQLYHQDLDNVLKTTSINGTPFREKLSQIFETFLPILQYGVDLFGTIPSIRLPKSASNVFLEAMQILHCCQEMKGVLGGMVLYQNRVVATQLSAGLTKNLVSTDPYRIKSPAESLATTFHMPIGVQLLKVYIEHKEYTTLAEEAKFARASYEDIEKRKECNKKLPSGIGKSIHIPKEQFGGMKRDISRIFTVPEEEGESETPDDNDMSRINGVGNTSQEPFSCGGQCTTPMKGVNLGKVLHERVVSICRVSDSEESDINEKSLNKEADSTIPDIVKDTIKLRTFADSTINTKETPNFLINFPRNELRRCQSWNELSFHKPLSSNRIPMRGYSFGLPKVTQALLGEVTNDFQDDEDKTLAKHFYNTITDPNYPVFRCDGLPISRSLFDQHLTQHYKLLNENKPMPVASTLMNVPMEQMKPVRPKVLSMGENDVRKSSPSKPFDLQADKQPDTVVPQQETPSKQELYRRSLSLPLKNLTSESNDDDSRRKSTSFPVGALPLESPTIRTRVMGTLPLTPLMAKLSSLAAFEEKSSGFWSRDNTPCESKEFGVTLEDIPSCTSSVSQKVENVVENTVEAQQTESEKLAGKTPEKAVLYVFGQQSMALLLLLEEDFAIDPELIHSLWETSVSSLNCLEAHLRQCLEHCAQGNDSESYSYICLDPQWDMLQRGGPWGCLELDLVSSVHDDFRHSDSLTEIVVRCEDSTVYGYQCGKTEIFYQQSSSGTVGLPTPSDLMGVVPMKARRRLERDHGIVLL